MRAVRINKDVKIDGILNRFPLSSLIAQEVDGKVAIKDFESNELELVEPWDNISDGAGNLYGSNLQDVIDVLNIEFQVSNVVEGVIQAGETIETSVKFNEFVSAWIDSEELGGEITPTGTFDPNNVSTNEANLINGNLTDLCYHNNSQGSTNKELPAVDLGSLKTVASISVYWWNNTYTASNYKIQGSVDGQKWTDLAINLNSTGVVGTANNPQTIPVSGDYRYLRVFSVQGNNATWTVLSEMKFYDVGGSIRRNIFNSSDIEVNEMNGFVELINNSTREISYKIIKR